VGDRIGSGSKPGDDREAIFDEAAYQTPRAGRALLRDLPGADNRYRRCREQVPIAAEVEGSKRVARIAELLRVFGVYKKAHADVVQLDFVKRRRILLAHSLARSVPIRSDALPLGVAAMRSAIDLKLAPGCNHSASYAPISAQAAGRRRLKGTTEFTALTIRML
jgi:hypothetical protein